jgi:hypothetical protein
MEKQIVAGKLDDEKARVHMNTLGLSDTVDQDRLLFALAVIRDYGAQLPSEPTNGGEPKPPESASDAQLALIADLVKRKNVPAPDLPLTKVDASAIISSLQAGTYDPSKWSVPF